MSARLPSAPIPPARHGFTLVEMLVAIGIIVLLVAILLPVVGQSREQARRALCLSNLRQLYLVYHQYSQDMEDRVPIGYRMTAAGVGCKQWDSMVYSGSSRKFCIFGTLYVTGYLKQPAILFCPSENDPQSTWNSPLNPWPPGPIGSGANVYGGYAQRPDYALPDEVETVPNVTLPRFGDFAGKALFADLPHLPLRVDTRHRGGINVCYGDGSAHWVDRAAFNAPLSKCTSISPAANAWQDAIWTALDLAQ